MELNGRTAVLTGGAGMSGDGRSARRDRNRLAVLDAVIELFSEGVLEPTPDDVAARVGLSARSVYRYFVDRDALLRAAIDRSFERVMPLYLILTQFESLDHYRIHRGSSSSETRDLLADALHTLLDAR